MDNHTHCRLSDSGLFLLAEKIIRHRSRLLIGLFGFTEHDVPDIQQELFLELYKRKGNFDPEKSKEATFITRVVESKILDLIKQRQAKCRDWRKCRQSLNQTVTLPGIGVIEKIETLEFEQDSDPLLILDVRLLLERLPPELRKFCQVLKFYRINEALEEFSMPHSAFFRKLQALKDIFLQAGVDGKFLSKTLPPLV
jgi:DNA-directed RNA polymerase specialized sigma24 family protein